MRSGPAAVAAHYRRAQRVAHAAVRTCCEACRAADHAQRRGRVRCGSTLPKAGQSEKKVAEDDEVDDMVAEPMRRAAVNVDKLVSELESVGDDVDVPVIVGVCMNFDELLDDVEVAVKVLVAVDGPDEVDVDVPLAVDVGDIDFVLVAVAASGQEPAQETSGGICGVPGPRATRRRTLL